MATRVTTARHVVLASLIPATGFFFAAGSFWLPTTKFGVGPEFFTLTMAFFVLGILATIPVAIGFVFASRPYAGFYLVALIVSLFAMYFGFRCGADRRMKAFRSLAERSETLIGAIAAFQEQRGRPPQQLDELVPGFLPSVPSTGMGGYPHYRYLVGDDAKEYGKNEWAIEVFTPRPGINFDCFLYFPNQNYPEYGFGGSLERIGSWAYVHE